MGDKIWKGTRGKLNKLSKRLLKRCKSCSHTFNHELAPKVGTQSIISSSLFTSKYELFLEEYRQYTNSRSHDIVDGQKEQESSPILNTCRRLIGLSRINEISTRKITIKQAYCKFRLKERWGGGGGLFFLQLPIISARKIVWKILAFATKGFLKAFLLALPKRKENWVNQELPVL